MHDETKGWKCGTCRQGVDEGDMVFGKHICPSPKQEEWDVEHDIIRIGNLIGCDLCKKGDEIRNNPVCVPKMTAFRLSARTEVLNQANEKISNLLRTWSVEKGGYGVLNEAITDIIKGMMNEK